MAFEYLKRRFSVERLGNLTLNWVKVLVYLGNSKRGGRESSAVELAKELDLGSENVITEYAYPALLKNGFIRLLADNLPERDANSYEVTRKGRRALGHLLNVVGFVELGIMVGISLVVGAVIGIMYPAYIQYPAYFPAIFVLTVSAGVVEAFFLFVFVRMARQRRREILSILLQKSS